MHAVRAAANYRFGFSPNSLAQNKVFIRRPSSACSDKSVARAKREGPPLWPGSPGRAPKSNKSIAFPPAEDCRGANSKDPAFGGHTCAIISRCTSSGRSASPSGTVSAVRWRFALWTSGSRTAIRPRRPLSCETASRMGSATPGSAALAACYGVCLGRGGYRITVPRSGVPGPGWVRPLNTPPLRRAIS